MTPLMKLALNHMARANSVGPRSPKLKSKLRQVAEKALERAFDEIEGRLQTGLMLEARLKRDGR